ASRAKQTFIASASTRYSYATEGDLNWDSFARNWLAALTGRDVNGHAVQRCAPYGVKSDVTVHEAFVYAMTCPSRNPFDSPSYAASSERACNLTLTVDTDLAAVLQRTMTVPRAEGSTI